MSKDGKEEPVPLRALYNKVLETLGKLHHTLYSQLHCQLHITLTSSLIQNTHLRNKFNIYNIKLLAHLTDVNILYCFTSAVAYSEMQLI